MNSLLTTVLFTIGYAVIGIFLYIMYCRLCRKKQNVILGEIEGKPIIAQLVAPLVE